MDGAQVEGESLVSPPNQIRMLLAPVVVAYDAFAIARQVKASAVLPVGPKNCRHTGSTIWPPGEGQRVIGLDTPRLRGGRDTRKARAVEAERVVRGGTRPRRSRDLDDNVGPGDEKSAPPASMDGKPK